MHKYTLEDVEKINKHVEEEFVTIETINDVLNDEEFLYNDHFWLFKSEKSFFDWILDPNDHTHDTLQSAIYDMAFEGKTWQDAIGVDSDDVILLSTGQILYSKY